MVKGTKKNWNVKTHAEIAAFCGVSTDTVNKWSADGMPGVPGKYPVDKIVQWLRQKGPWQRHAKSAPADTDDPLLAAAVDSPGLERYRLAKAAIAELDLEERRGALIELSKVRLALSRWSTILRRLGERLAKRFGNDAATALNESLDECHRAIGYEFCNRDPDKTAGRDAGLVSEAGASSDSPAD